MANLSILQEPLSDRLTGEMMALFNDYYARTPAGDGLPPLDFDWPTYYQLEKLGKFIVFGAREKGKLLGVNMYILLPHLHHRTKLLAICDGLSVHLDARGKGVGRALVDYALPRLKEMGVWKAVHNARNYHNGPTLFDKYPGFKAGDRCYAYDFEAEADEFHHDPSEAPAESGSGRPEEPAPAHPTESGRPAATT